ARVSSPSPGRSTLITSAPRSPSIMVQYGPESTLVRSSTRMPSRGRMTYSSRKRRSQLGEISYNEIRLMWCLAKWSLAAVDERGPHAVRLCANAIEGMIGNKQNAGAVMTNDLFRFRIGLPVRLEIAGILHRNDVIKRKANVRSGGLEHVSVAI